MAHWQLVGASVQGTAHRKGHLPCQDAHHYRVLPDGALLIAIADGAGSAEHSAEGADLAAKKVVTLMAAALQSQYPANKNQWRDTLITTFNKTRHTITKKAKTKNIQPQCFATTLTCAVAFNQGLAVAQIGDGLVVAQAEDGSLFVTLAPQRGEYANETAFITMKDALDHVETTFYPEPVQALALTTDGLLRLAMNISQQTPHQPFFQPLLTFVHQISNPAQAQDQLVEFLSSERVCARTDDDKTLVLAVHKND